MNQETIEKLASAIVEKRKESEQTDFMKAFTAAQKSATTTPKAPGTDASRLVRCLAAAKGDTERAARYAEKNLGDEAVAKALVTGNGEAGGFLVPEQMSTDIIELLRPRTAVRRMNPQIMPMNSGVLTIPRHNEGAAAGYIGESMAQNAEDSKFGQLRLVWKKLRTAVPISNELLSFSNPRADAIVRDDMVRAMAIREDQAFIRDQGTEYTPKGLRYWADSDNVITAADETTPNGTVAEGELRELMQAIEGNNIMMDRPGWMMSPRTKNFLARLREEIGGERVFPELQGQEPTLWGFPVAVTNNIPSNLGAGSDESEIYLVDFAHVIIGESSQMSIEVSDQASYTDGDGNLVSAFDREETVIKAVQHHDLVVRHDAAIAVLTGVKWGSA